MRIEFTTIIFTFRCCAAAQTRLYLPVFKDISSRATEFNAALSSQSVVCNDTQHKYCGTLKLSTLFPLTFSLYYTFSSTCFSLHDVFISYYRYVILNTYKIFYSFLLGNLKYVKFELYYNDYVEKRIKMKNKTKIKKYSEFSLFYIYILFY